LLHNAAFISIAIFMATNSDPKVNDSIVFCIRNGTNPEQHHFFIYFTIFLCLAKYLCTLIKHIFMWYKSHIFMWHVT
jgi:hypothetical protein